MSGDVRVLVVDDDPAVAGTLRRLVELAGHQARSTCDPRQFLQWHREWSPSHVMVDLAMPEMDGLELLQHLAGGGTDSAVVISSGVGPRILAAAARVAADHGLRVAGVIPKPFRLSAVSDLLRTPLPDASAGDREPARPARSADVADLRLALSDDAGSGRISVVYQPKVDLRSGQVAGFEALARWHHPELGQVPPPVFIAIAEAEGLIEPLTERVLDLAFGWCAGLPAPVHVAVNLSALSVGDPTFVARQRDHCERAGLAPERVTVELTETAATRDPVATLRNLTQLRVAGFALSLDDYGTGYSSMTQLAALPFSEIKIDRSFVRTATGSEESRALVRSVIDLGRDLDLVTVAEGVEDQETLDLVRSLGCDLTQGYFVSRPLAPEAARTWCLDQKLGTAR